MVKPQIYSPKTSDFLPKNIIFFAHKLQISCRKILDLLPKNFRLIPKNMRFVGHKYQIIRYLPPQGLLQLPGSISSAVPSISTLWSITKIYLSAVATVQMFLFRFCFVQIDFSLLRSQNYVRFNYSLIQYSTNLLRKNISITIQNLKIR